MFVVIHQTFDTDGFLTCVFKAVENQFLSMIFTSFTVLLLNMKQEILIPWETLLLVWSPVFLSTHWTNQRGLVPDKIFDARCTHGMCAGKQLWKMVYIFVVFFQTGTTGKDPNQTVSFSSHYVESRSPRIEKSGRRPCTRVRGRKCTYPFRRFIFAVAD